MKTSYSFGDIVLCPFQFTNGQGSKHRPVLILSHQREDFLVACISTQLDQGGAYDIILKPTDTNGLRADSIVRVAKLFTFSQEIFARYLGTIDRMTGEMLQHNMKKFVDTWM